MGKDMRNIITKMPFGPAEDSTAIDLMDLAVGQGAI